MARKKTSREKEITISQYLCRLCKHKWISRLIGQRPKKCPNCMRPDWWEQKNAAPAKGGN